ncbi:hypothetical protein Bache_2392 [Bacteroides helcogenes P 36-108]|uniref:Uncharacterized protein n=1 Tax=Bacteroides helcogenes (strain ATCC 35417 / DSM 20613 / JCM 6297 / CCUG 15421 / P 36-108) TaxID=693979 RepID=E6SU86_BACT6|nr:hypothetical protein Bache_2392 [Bacteroides helcogenes P 36-108]
MHSYENTFFITYKFYIQTIKCVQNLHELRTNCVQIVLFRKKYRKVRKQKNQCGFVRFLYRCNTLIINILRVYICTKVLTHDFYTIFVQGLGYVFCF